MHCVAGRYFDLCSGCEGKPWHESRAVMHWWLVSFFFFFFPVDVPHKCHGSDFLLVSQGFLLIWYFCLSLLIKKKKIFLSIPWPSHYLVFDFTASGKAAEFGQLIDGFMFESSTGLSRTWEFRSPLNSYLMFDRSFKILLCLNT